MLKFTSLTNFYFLPNFHDMRWGKTRILNMVQDQYGREAYNGDVYFFMAKNHRTVRMVSYENHKYGVHTYTFDKGYQFMKVEIENGVLVYKVAWRDIVAILESPVVKSINLKK